MINRSILTDRPKSSVLSGNTRFVILGLVLLGLVLRLPNLTRSLWYDEVMYSTSYVFSSLSDIWHLFLYDPAAPFYRVLLFFWMGVCGESELSVRIPSLLLGILSIGLTYEIARAYSNSSRVALLAAVLLCVSPIHVWYSQEATPYAATIFFFLSTVYAWLQLKKQPSHKGWFALYISMFLLAIFTHYFVAVFLVPFTLFGLALEFSLRKRILISHAAIFMSTVLALAVKHHFGNMVSGQAFLRPFSLFEWWMLYFNWFLQGNALWTLGVYGTKLRSLLREPLFLICQIIFCILFLRGLLSSRDDETWTQKFEVSCLVLWLPLVMFLLTLDGYRQLYIERYLLFVLPFFLIVLARGVASFSSAKAVIVCSSAAVVLGVAAYTSLLYKSDKGTVYKQNADWRSAAHYLVTQSTPAKESIILTTVPAVELAYYFPKEKNASVPRIVFYEPESFHLLLTRTPFAALYLIKNNYWVQGADKVLQRLKDDKRFKLANSQFFKGLEIYTFVPQEIGTVELEDRDNSTAKRLKLPSDLLSSVRLGVLGRP